MSRSWLHGPWCQEKPVNHSLIFHDKRFHYLCLAVLFRDDRILLLLTHWGRVTHICVSRLTITGSDNGLSPGRRQAIIWTNAGILLIGPLGTNFSENSIEILTFSFTKMRLKESSAKWRPFCLGLNVLKVFMLASLSVNQVILMLVCFQAITWTNEELVSITPPETNFGEIASQ